MMKRVCLFCGSNNGNKLAHHSFIGGRTRLGSASPSGHTAKRARTASPAPTTSMALTAATAKGRLNCTYGNAALLASPRFIHQTKAVTGGRPQSKDEEGVS